uniref:Vitellogenin domain-containing protein n=1 Tax=Romanomermis culicivorax TaxID=13658 RepID=A0A915IAL0_ROMCU
MVAIPEDRIISSGRKGKCFFKLHVPPAAVDPLLRYNKCKFDHHEAVGKSQFSSHDDEDIYGEERDFHIEENQEHQWDRRNVPESWRKPNSRSDIWDQERRQGQRHQDPRGQESEWDQSTPQNFIYDYEFVTETGAGRSQRRGFKFDAKIHYQKRTSICLLKMLDFQTWTTSRAEEIHGALSRAQLESKQSNLLSLPVKFQCRNGELKNPMFDGEDEPWSMNIKRGVLNMFHVNMEAATSHRHAQLYEETVEGECQTDYSFTPFHDKSSRQKMFNVTKSINLKNCREKPHIFYDLPSSDACLAADQNCRKDNIEDHLIHSMSTATFTVVGDAARATVRNANASSQYVYEPLGSRGDKIVTTVHQQLRLSSNRQNQKLEEPKNARPTVSGLKYSFDWDMAFEQASMFGETENLRKLSQNHQFKEPANRFVSILKKFGAENNGNEDRIREFLNVATLLKQADRRQLEEIEQKIMTKIGQKEDQFDNLYVQMLAVCGTKVCADRLIHLINEKRVSQLVAILALKELAHTQIPSEEIAKKILNEVYFFLLALDELSSMPWYPGPQQYNIGHATRWSGLPTGHLRHKIMAHQSEQRENKENTYFVRQTLWLLSGTMMHSLCSNSLNKFAIEQQQHHKRRPCSEKFKREFINIISQHLQHVGKWEDKLIFTKTLANAGLPESLPLLEKLVKNKAPEGSWLRNSALFAMRKMARRRSGYVQSLLLPIVADSSEPTELRLSAIKILLESRPDSSILSRFSQMSTTTNSGDDEISNFLKSALNSVANSTKLCDRLLILNSKLAAASSHRNSKSKKNPRSTMNWFSLTDHEQQSSMDLEYFASYGNQSTSSDGDHNVLPKHLSLAFDWFKFGFYQKNLLSWGLVTTDPDSALNNAYRALMNQHFDRLRSGKLGRYIEDVWSRGFRHYDDENEDKFDVSVWYDMT